MTATTDFMMNIGALISVILVIFFMVDSVLFALENNKRFLAHDIAKQVAFAIMEAEEKGISEVNLAIGGEIEIKRGVVEAKIDEEKEMFPYPLEINASGQINGTKVFCERKSWGIECWGK